MRVRAAVLAVVVFSSLVSFAQTTINVPADQPTIQAAINAANNGDTVLVAPGTYVENINFNGKNVAVRSSNGASTTIIDGNAAGTVITFNHGESAGAVLDGFTIRNGRQPNMGGGGIYIVSASPSILNNVISSNQALETPGILISGGAPLIQGNTITGNTTCCGSGGDGGGIKATASASLPGSLRIIGNTITNNSHTSGPGGGISAGGDGSLLIQNNYIAGNFAYNGGGGIAFNGTGSSTIVGNVIANNSAGQPGHGGGFAGGPFSSNGQLQFLNNTLYGDSAGEGDSEIMSDSLSASVVYQNNLIYATSGTAVKCNGTLPVTNNNLLYNPNGLGDICPAFTGGNGNLIAEPGMTNPAAGDFTLHAGSPAIDAGVSSSLLPATDRNGNTRILDGNNDGVATVDIGALEFTPGAAAGWATMSPLSANFPSTAVGSTAGPVALTLLNNGNANLTITSISVNSAFAQVNNCPAVLAVGTSCSIQVSFSPTANGPYSGALTLVSDGGNGTVNVPLSGTGNGVFGTLSPASIDFGEVNADNATWQTVTLTNQGTAPLVISSFAFTGPYSKLAGGCTEGNSIAPGGSCQMGVVFRPNGTGTFTGSLRIVSNAASFTPAAVTFTGTGVGGWAVYSTTSIAFANQLVGTTSAPQPVVLTNTGNRPLTLYYPNGIPITADFAQTNDCPAQLASGTSCTFNVTFTPPAAIYDGGSMTIYTDSFAGNNQQGIFFTGRGVTPTITVSTTSIDFGSVAVGSAPWRSIFLTSSGGTDLSITGISVSGGGFQQTNDCPAVLPDGTHCMITVTFAPTASGAASGTVTVTHNASGGTSTVSLTGTGTAPLFSATPSSLTFSGQNVGTTSAAQVVTLQNTGTSAGTIGSLSVIGPFTQTNNCGGSVAAGASCSLWIVFSPTAQGALTGTLMIAGVGPAGSPAVALSGTGIAPVGTFSPASLTFSGQSLGTTSAAQTVTLQNTGTATLTLSGFTVIGDFAQTNNCPASLAAGASCTVQVTFTPHEVGSRGGSLTVSSNSVNAVTPVSLSGTGNAAEAIVSPVSLSFNQVVGTTSPAQTVTLTNPGNVALSITSITATSPFAQTNNCGASLAAGANCTISVTYSPVNVGTNSGTITISDNAYQNPTQTVTLSGTSGQPTVNVTPASLSFPVTIVGGASAPQTVTVTNTGSTYPLTITGISINNQQFHQTNNCPAQLAAGQSCTISVTLTPNVTGAVSATLAVADNATGPNPQWVSLSGSGGVPAAGISPGSLTYVTTPVGAHSASSAVTLSNTGTVAMTISSIATTSDFAQSNNCGSSLAAGASCTINVSFTPTASGSRTGQLTVTDNSSPATQTVSLSGSAVDFTIGINQTSVSITAGQTASYDVQARAVGGTYPTTIALSCSGAPAGSTCSMTPTSLIAGQNAKLKIVTTKGVTPSGTYTITATGTANGVSRSDTATLIVK